MSPEVALVLIQLTDLNHSKVDVNVAEIVSLRDATDSGLLAEGAKCIVNTADGKHFTVIETCEEIRRLIVEAD